MVRSCFLYFLLFFSCSQAWAQLKEFEWLVGSWKRQNKSSYEVWKVASDGKSLVGKSFKVLEQDTVFLEDITIVFKEGSYYYVPDVAGKQGPVYFKVSTYHNFGFEATNPDHDFPKVIRYELIRNEDRTLLHAAIEGNGKTIPFSFEKME